MFPRNYSSLTDKPITLQVTASRAIALRITASRAITLRITASDTSKMYRIIYMSGQRLNTSFLMESSAKLVASDAI